MVEELLFITTLCYLISDHFFSANYIIADVTSQVSRKLWEFSGSEIVFFYLPDAPSNISVARPITVEKKI